LPSATTSNGAATGYLWTSPFGTVGSTGTIDSGTVNSRIITVTYTSNAAATIGDSIKLQYTSGCGNGAVRAQKLTNLVKNCLNSGDPIFSKIKMPSMEVSPNPNDGNFRLRINNIDIHETYNIVITDQLGNLIHKELVKSNFNQFDKFIQLSEKIRPGIYWIRITGSKINKAMRIVIQ
jgi:hypothetical protein